MDFRVCGRTNASGVWHDGNSGYNLDNTIIIQSAASICGMLGKVWPYSSLVYEDPVQVEVYY